MTRYRSQDEIKKHYNKIGRTGIYDTVVDTFLLGRDSYLRKRLINKYTIRPGMDVLDVGTGTGRNIPIIKKCIGDDGFITGVDISPGMLSKARTYAESHENVRIVNSDIFDFTPSQRYDRIVASYVFSVIPNPSRLAVRLHDLLKPGGRLLVLAARAPETNSLLFSKLLEFEEWIAAANLSVQPSHLLRTNGLSIQRSFRFWRYIHGITARLAPRPSPSST